MTAQTTDELWTAALQWTTADWLQQISLLSREQITAIIPAASSKYDVIQWKEKLFAALDASTTATQLEAIGKALSFEQCSCILDITHTNAALLLKLPPLFVGLSPQVFRIVIAQATNQQLHILKQEALTEAMQHQLTLLVHNFSSLATFFQRMIEEVRIKIQAIELKELTNINIETYSQRVTHCYHTGVHLLIEASKALAIAWNTDRPDLIEPLSRLKESIQKTLAHQVGMPGAATTESSTLWATLEQHLNSVFTETNITGKIEKMPDETPVLEALAKFGVWYLQDYWKIGLLPLIKDEKELAFDATTDPKTQQLNRDKLFVEVHRYLNQLGLVTLSDLKANRIYSKRALQEFVKQRS